MSFLLSSDYYRVRPETGLSPFQTVCAYLGGSFLQTVGDNPMTAYRQLVQQYAKDGKGQLVAPERATAEARGVFVRAPVTASLSGVGPRLVGVMLKRVPKFGILLGYSYVTGDDGDPGFAAATAASVLSAPFINPVRMIEKQQRVQLKQTGREQPVAQILRESAQQRFAPLFRGTVPLMGHSLVSALLGLVGQPRLQKHLETRLGAGTGLDRTLCNLFASAVVSPIYVVLTNPISRIEVILQTHAIQGKPLSVGDALRELARDARVNGLAGAFRGQSVGIAKAVLSLTLFHEGRQWCMRQLRAHNERRGLVAPRA
jgi:hypothetical protein